MKLQSHYDVVVIGSGAGGGTIAALLAEGGKRVLILEKGRNAPRPGDVGRDHLRNQRLSHYGVNAGPDDLRGNPRVFVPQGGQGRVMLGHEAYSNNAFIVGGGTRVYGGQAWRFHPLDFKMASTYGVPEGSSLADWPIDRDELTPFYERVEHELGVCGDTAVMETAGFPPFAKPYPMPPVTPDTAQGRTLRAGAMTLGWKTLPVPLAINSVPYQGRPACAHCGECPGFSCPVDAKNGTHNTFLPRALLTGRCDLLAEATAYRIETGDNGIATGVSYFGPDGNPYTVNASVVIVACGAIETARLLQLSGIGNDHVGRHVQGHVYPGAIGRFPWDTYDGIGPGASTATVDFVHGNPDVIGGAMLADDFVVLPITFWKRHLPPHVPHWGAAAKEWMHLHYRRSLMVTGPVQEIPDPNMRVTLDEQVRDKYGLPVARLRGVVHPETVRTAKFIHERAREWLQASGAVEVWGNAPGAYFSGGQHQAGTCRMSDDPEQGVTDRDCRVHGYNNLYLGDGSVHVTNGVFNPFLTIQALAYRTAKTVLSRW